MKQAETLLNDNLHWRLLVEIFDCVILVSADGEFGSKVKG